MKEKDRAKLLEKMDELPNSDKVGGSVLDYDNKDVVEEEYDEKFVYAI